MASYEGGFLREDDGSLSVTTDATGATFQNGYLRSPTGQLVVTDDDTGAAFDNGYLRAANGALVVEDGGEGTYSGGALRAANGALIVSSDTVAPDFVGGALRDTGGRIVVSGLTPPSGAAPYPSRWRVEQHHFVDENDVDLGVVKGFNWNVIGTGLPFGQDDFDDLAVMAADAAVEGEAIIRMVLPWDLLQPVDGASYDGITSATSAATAGSAFDKIDETIRRAYAAGVYCYLDLHLLDASSSNGRVPAWARNGTLPSGSGNSWTWFITNGQGITETLAQRYGDPLTSPLGEMAKAVVGFCPNEPASASIPEIQTGFASIVSWWQPHAPDWPVWIAPTSYGGGTPYPTSGTQIEIPDLLALDVNSRGIAIDYRSYLNMVGSASADGYQANGAIGPIEQVANGAQYHGWGGDYDYPDTQASRDAIEAHLAPLVTLRDQHPTIAICMMEMGMDHKEPGSNHDAYVRDVVTASREAGFTAEVWWQHGFGTTGFDARDEADGSYRPAISGTGWFQNATARAAGATEPPAPPASPADIVGVGALGVTPNSATAAMTATGQTYPAGIEADDVALMFTYFDGGAVVSGMSITAPAGYSQLVDLPHQANGNMLRIYGKVLDGTEDGTAAPSPTFNGGTTGTSGAVGECRVVVVRDADISAFPGSVLAGVSGGNGFTNQQNMGAIAGFTPTSDNAHVFVFAGKKATFTSIALLTGDGLTWTEQFESPTTNASDAGMVLNTAPIEGAAVAIANKTFTVTGGSTANGLGIMFAIRPG